MWYKEDLKVIESFCLNDTWEIQLWKSKILVLEDGKDKILEDLFYLYFLNITRVLLSILKNRNNHLNS